METINLPPGFRFHPSDDELLTEYLFKKITDPKFISMVMGDVDLNKWEPRELPSKAKMKDGKDIYFFCLKDKKYPTGKRTNRATKEGYWKATGKDNPIFKFNTIRAERDLIGMKKTLVFYTGRAPKGEKTNWVMHEFRLNDNLKDEWVVCRIHEKKNPNKRNQPAGSDLSNQLSEEQIFIDSLSDPTYQTYDSNNLSMISSASESIETNCNNPSTIDGTNYSEMMMNPPNNFIYPSNNLPNMNHKSNPIYIPNPPNLTLITNNQDYTNLGLIHQGQMMSNTTTTSMVAPNHGTAQGYANSGLIHQGEMTRDTRTTSMVAPNHGTNRGYANLGLMHQMQMMSNATTTSMVAPNNGIGIYDPFNPLG